MSTLDRIQVRKELRELLPWWAGTVAAVLACGILGRQLIPVLGGEPRFQWFMAGLLVYAAGVTAIGALSIGHEYTHHTLEALLAQPIDRRRLLLTKVAVLVPLAASLLVVVRLWLWADPAFARDRAVEYLTVMPSVIALFIAPWLTMACRGPLAGAVFAIAIPSLLMAIGRRAWPGADGWNVMWQGTAALAAVGAFMTWRSFVALEAVGGQQAEIDMPAWSRRQAMADDASRARGRGWQLVLKELHLQQMTFVVSGFFAAVWVAAVLARGWFFGFSGPDLQTIAFFHGCLVAVMTGALASAEERRFGSDGWQLLLPMAARKQWAIKAGVAISLSLGLALGLPALLMRMLPGAERLTFHNEFAYAAILICIAALYVSSLSSSGMRALLSSFPTLIGALLAWATVLRPIVRIGQSGFRHVAPAVGPLLGISDYATCGGAVDGVLLTLLGGLALILLRLGHANHRFVEGGITRVRRQFLWIAGYFAAGMLLLGFLAAVCEVSLAGR